MSRILSRSDFIAGATEIAPAQLGLLPFGVVCGVGAQSAGASIWESFGLSALMFSGAAQILAAQLMAAGAPVGVTILTCLVVGLRFLMYSAAMAPYLKSMPARWRNGLAFLLTDQVFAATIRRFREAEDPRSAASYFLGAGLFLWTAWQCSCLAGFWAGNVIPAAWSLDFFVPLCFLSLLVPALDNRSTRIAALAAGVAVVALDALPMRLSLICAGLVGIVAGMISEAQGRAR